MLRVRAGRVHPVTAPSIEDGAVLVDTAGRIAAVGPHRDVPTPSESHTLEFRDAELVPGFVNCHTHLELTHLAGRHTEPDFPAWIRGVRALKDGTGAEEFDASAEAGLRDCWSRGVTCVADTGSTGSALAALTRLGGRGVSYHEVFGPDPRSAQSCFSEFERQIAGLRRQETGHAVLGVSPHAPYTVSDALYRLVADFAHEQRLPLAVHLAESDAETLLVRDGAGPFADALRARGISVQARGISPVAYLAQLGVLERATACLCIHCVNVDEHDIHLLGGAGAAVAHCPRSNSAHGHGAAPLAAFRRAGIRVGMGTDSVVSVGDLDLRAEAQHAGLDGDDALRMLTIEGARALGWERIIGSLEPGKWADLAVFNSPAVAPRPAASALLTCVGGRIVHGVDLGA
jgi:5-methylthioadenosine/S-adenosylhomocysteine deaminase